MEVQIGIEFYPQENFYYPEWIGTKRKPNIEEFDDVIIYDGGGVDG